MKKSRCMLTILCVVIFGCLQAEPVWANVGIPVIFVTFYGMAYALMPIIIIEAVVYVVRLNLSVWAAAMIVTFANLITTFVGLPITWILFFIISKSTSSLIIDNLPKAWKPRNEYLVTDFFTPWWYPDPSIEKNSHWIYPLVTLILLVPFFFASWFIEYKITFRILEHLDGDMLSSTVYVGNLLTYFLLALVVVGIGVHDAQRELKNILYPAVRWVKSLRLPSGFSTPRRRLLRYLLIFTSACAIVVILYVGLCLFVVSSSLKPIRTDYESTPVESGLSAERIRFKSAWDNVPLTGWLLPSSGNRAIVMVHGLDGNAWSGAEPEIVRFYLDAGFHVLVFDLRGCGQSGGEQLGLGWHERGDVRAAVDILLNRGIEPGRIGLHGTSYGAATAILSAAVIPEVGAVISDSAFADMRDLMDAEIENRTGIPSQFSRFALRPGVALVARLFYSLNFDVIAPVIAVSQVSPRPILFVHGENDEVIPLDHVYRLKGASTDNVNDLWVLPGRGHTEGVWIWNEPREVSSMRKAFQQRIVMFFDQSLGTVLDTRSGNWKRDPVDDVNPIMDSDSYSLE